MIAGRKFRWEDNIRLEINIERMAPRSEHMFKRFKYFVILGPEYFCIS